MVKPVIPTSEKIGEAIENNDLDHVVDVIKGLGGLLPNKGVSIDKLFKKENEIRKRRKKNKIARKSRKKNRKRGRR